MYMYMYMYTYLCVYVYVCQFSFSIRAPILLPSALLALLLGGTFPICLGGLTPLVMLMGFWITQAGALPSAPESDHWPKHKTGSAVCTKCFKLQLSRCFRLQLHFGTQTAFNFHTAVFQHCCLTCAAAHHSKPKTFLIKISTSEPEVQPVPVFGSHLLAQLGAPYTHGDTTCQGTNFTYIVFAFETPYLRGVQKFGI